MKKFFAGIVIACLLLFITTAVQAESVTMTFNRDALYLTVGHYITMTATVEPYGVLRQGVVYSTSDPSVATVEQTGKVRGLQVGICELTAVSKYDDTVSATIPVYVIVPVQELRITADTYAVVLDHTLQLSASVEPENATLSDVTYTSSDPSVLTVSPDGLVTGVGHGRATVTAESGDGRASAQRTITVKQPPESVTVSPTSVTVAEGKTEQLKATVLPDYTDDKTVLWTSADESVATVSTRGVVTGVELGETMITATCLDNPDATFTIPVNVLKLATGISFNQDSYTVELGDTLQLAHTVYPAETSNQAVTYSIRNTRIATIDENGHVTPLQGGTTTVTIATADGSRKSATATLTVPIHVTGVHFHRSDVRVGQGYYSHITVNIEPYDATNKNMTWVSDDPDIATVTGDANTCKVVGGKNWGRTRIVGTTEDGGYTVSFYVNVGSLYRAVTVWNLEIRNGAPYITFRNNSDMTITQVRYYMKGLKPNLKPAVMSTTGDIYTLYGTYDLPLYPDETTQHGMFTFFAPSQYPKLTYLYLVITGWSTDTGYYDYNGTIQYTYTIEDGRQPTGIYPASTDYALFE